MTKKDEAIFIGVGDQVIELTGKDKEVFIAQREADNKAQALLEAEYKKKEETKKSALKKLAEIAGLTDEEIAAII